MQVVLLRPAVDGLGRRVVSVVQVVLLPLAVGGLGRRWVAVVLILVRLVGDWQGHCVGFDSLVRRAALHFELLPGQQPRDDMSHPTGLLVRVSADTQTEADCLRFV